MTAYLLGAGLLGLIVGSFLNVVVVRLPSMMDRHWRHQCNELLHPETVPSIAPEIFNLVLPRSRCVHCNGTIPWWANIPIVSYILLRGRCHTCKSPISVRYPIIEALSAALTTFVVYRFGYDVATIGILVVTWALVTLTAIDLEHQLLPDSITLPLLWFALLWSVVGYSSITLQNAVIGAMAGYLSLWSIYWAFKIFTGKEGMGYGDFKLLAMLGAWCGWTYLPGIILLSSLLGAVVGIFLVLFRKHDKNIPIPFGPYLAIAGWVYLVWGEELNKIHLSLLN